jgi:hypothetical protein
MKMTLHENDNQALVALRSANRQVAKFGGDWESILRGKIKIIGDPFSGITMPPAGAASRPDNYSPTVPPRPRAPVPPQQPARSYTPPPPKAPANGDSRTNFSAGTCKKCRKPVAPSAGREIYSSLLGCWEIEHHYNRCPQPPRRDNERTNKFAGNCILCRQRVEALQGTTYHNGVKWMTEHLKNACPPPDQRKRKQPLTSDDLMA